MYFEFPSRLQVIHVQQHTAKQSAKIGGRIGVRKGIDLSSKPGRGRPTLATMGQHWVAGWVADRGGAGALALLAVEIGWPGQRQGCSSRVITVTTVCALLALHCSSNRRTGAAVSWPR